MISIYLFNETNHGFGVDYDSMDQVYYILDEISGGKSILADKLADSIHEKNYVHDSLAKRIGRILLNACNSGQARTMLDNYRQLAEEKLDPHERPEFLTVDTILYLAKLLNAGGITEAFTSS